MERVCIEMTVFRQIADGLRHFDHLVDGHIAESPVHHGFRDVFEVCVLL